MLSPENQPDPYAPWRRADYRRYALGWFLIAFSTRVEFVAITAYLAVTYDVARGSFLTGLLGLVQALPVILLAVPGGHIADRFDRRWIMVINYLLCTAAAIGMLAVVMFNGPLVWIYVLLGVAAVGWALSGPARQAVMPQLVPSELFSNAVAWNSSVFYIATIAGFVVGGTVVAVAKWLGLSAYQAMAIAFALVVLCRIVAVIAIALVKIERTVREREPTASWDSVVAGIRFVWNNNSLLACLTLDMFAVLLGGATYLVPIYAEKILHVGGLGLGLLLAGDMIGAVMMAVVLAHRPPLKRPGVALLWAVVGFGAATIVFGLSQWFWLSFSMMILLGALDNISVVVRHTLVQMLTPDEMRGRVSAVNGVFIHASNGLGGLESGVTSGLFGPVISVVGGGIGAIFVVIGIAWHWPEILKIGPLDSIRPETLAEPEEEP